MYNPVTTYRIQFNKEFTFKNFKENLEYFFLLNPGTIYASPVFEAAPGSMHGYNVTNPNIVNPEIGRHIEFVEISDELIKRNIGWMQDIVPNHMAFHMNNHWLLDVLEKGKSSKYSAFFDIDFDHPDFSGKIMVPFLGKPLNVINDNEIKIDWLKSGFVFRYYDFFFPANFESFQSIFTKYLSDAPDDLHTLWKEYGLSVSPKKDFVNKEYPEVKVKIENIVQSNYKVKDFVNNIVTSINSDKIFLEQLLEQQYYDLQNWQESQRKINFRRFFTVNSLICLNIDKEEVFGAYHSFIEQQVLHKRFNALRIDHIDGLLKPLQYVEKLRNITNEDTYIVAEKILQKEESLTPGISLQGTSGYDFLGIVNNLFTFNKNYPVLAKFYRKITGIKDDIDDIIYNKKKFILFKRMLGELDNLSRIFEDSEFVKYGNEITRETIKQAIAEFLLHFPVYKLYSDFFPLISSEAELVKSVFSKAVKKNPTIAKSLNALQNVFLSQTGFDLVKKEKALLFFLRCMQFTGPIMAKGVEDTVMYYYNAFICHNEVGDTPGASGITVDEYHELMVNRYKNIPLTMNATSTHDTKRGEDVRARLNIISELPDEWMSNVEKWMKINHKYKLQVDGSDSPTVNEEYFIYQTLIGVFPFEGKADETFLKRLDDYLIKSLREAKTDSNWNEPNEEHEQAAIYFTRQILSAESEFLPIFLPFQQKISNYGIINSLSQLILKSTSPGIPDYYQGTELWDLSMVDPDNRRPVNYSHRYHTLKGMIDHFNHDPEGLFYDLYMNRVDGRLKLWMTYQLMQERRSEPELFIHGKYIPLEVKGKYSNNLIAYARTYKSTWYLVVVPMYLSAMAENKFRQEPGHINWEDTMLIIPDNAPKWWYISSGRSGINFESQIYMSDIMKFVVPTFLKGKTGTTKRQSGILAHISSLPGKYGVGDLGEEGYNFVDFLNESGQSFWQVLPFNPVEKNYGYSPYSSTSAFAGNFMFLSPDLLVKTGLLSGDSLSKTKFDESDRADIKKAIDFRTVLLEEVFCNYKGFPRPFLQKKFNTFCKKEEFWLDDYALFIILKQEYNDTPWNEWPDSVKNRDQKALDEFKGKYEWEIEKEKFIQFLFHTQWEDLKHYANKNGVQLIGDMSFYVNYDSADVWANPQYFKLDHYKNPYSIAGVPPDYFSSTGQLWNMPVYNWDKMKENGYDWWIRRIQRNIQLCDLVRFDHFRGFSAYWEVPAGEKTAVNGKWTDGPGNDFFVKVRRAFPSMPFIAEDLGMIDDKVYKLRDDFSLPGMVVLQFAFGDNTPGSSYIPHNHIYNSIVYTGTHDNNTTKGWFLNELGSKNKKEAEGYFGHAIHDVSCHNEFIRMAYSSVARIAIIPVQDVLGLNEGARLNKPSTTEKNWDWKLKKQDIKKEHSENLLRMAILFGRI